jgi:hypothetical protein
MRYREDLPTNLIICSLIIDRRHGLSGALGYPHDIGTSEWSGSVAAAVRPHETDATRDGRLLLFGFTSILFLEWNGVLADLTVRGRILAAAFHSVTCRTAGFNSIDVGALTSASLLITILLMMIGGGPCSTAGGFQSFHHDGSRACEPGRRFAAIRESHLSSHIPISAVEKAIATRFVFGIMGILALTTLLIVEQSAPTSAGAVAVPQTPHGHFWRPRLKSSPHWERSGSVRDHLHAVRAPDA